MIPMDTFTSGDVDAFAAATAALPGDESPKLRHMREAGRQAFAEAGWPTKRIESWKYTDLRHLRAATFRPAASVTVEASLDRAPSLLSADAVAARLVFVDGRYRAALSTTDGLPNGVQVAPLDTALNGGDAEWLEVATVDSSVLTARPMLALNTALVDSGWVLRVGRGVVLDRPIEIVSVTGLTETPVFANPRAIIVLEDNASADVIEYAGGPGTNGGFINAAMDIQVGRGARLRHYRVQAETDETFALATLSARVDGDASYETFGLATGARLSRYDARVSLVGPGATCSVSGAYLMRGAQHVDNTTEIEHRAPHTACREVFKGVLDDESRGVFQGRIMVHREAQKTDGHQLNKTLLLSDSAEIDAKPELEIYADDVKCSHGATAGELDAAALFYLRSRGLDNASARGLLIEAFLTEALDEVSNPAVAEAMTDGIKAWMANRTERSA